MVKPECDRISRLPSDMRVKILTYMPIKDAAKTSVLSSVWKHEWTLMPYICIKQDEFASPALFVHFVDMTLLLRTAPIKIFSIQAGELNSQELDQVLDRWMVLLSSNKIEEAWLILPRNCHIPSSLFTCSFLKKLELVGGNIEVPPNFEGFKLLTELSLGTFFASEKDLERLILGCPMLKILLLWLMNLTGNINVCAPNLQLLEMGTFGKLNLQTPHLTELIFLPWLDQSEELEKFDPLMDITMEQAERNFTCMFGQCLHCITRISLNRTLMYFGFNCLQGKLRVSFPNLKYLWMEFCASCPIETASAQFFIQSAPNIEKLTISLWYYVSVESDPDLTASSFKDCSFARVRILKIMYFHFTEEEVALLERLLLTSPSLEKVFFFTYDDQDAGNFHEDLEVFLPSEIPSNKVEIIIENLSFSPWASTPSGTEA